MLKDGPLRDALIESAAIGSVVTVTSDTCSWNVDVYAAGVQESVALNLQARSVLVVGCTLGGHLMDATSKYADHFSVVRLGTLEILHQSGRLHVEAPFGGSQFNVEQYMVAGARAADCWH